MAPGGIGGAPLPGARAERPCRHGRHSSGGLSFLGFTGKTATEVGGRLYARLSSPSQEVFPTAGGRRYGPVTRGGAGRYRRAGLGAQGNGSAALGSATGRFPVRHRGTGRGGVAVGAPAKRFA